MFLLFWSLKLSPKGNGFQSINADVKPTQKKLFMNRNSQKVTNHTDSKLDKRKLYIKTFKNKFE